MRRTTIQSALLWGVGVVVAVGASSAAVSLATRSVTTPPSVGLSSPGDDGAATTPIPQATASTSAEVGPTPTPTSPTSDDAEPTTDGASDGTEPSEGPTPTSARPTEQPTDDATPDDDAMPDDEATPDDDATTDDESEAPDDESEAPDDESEAPDDESEAPDDESEEPDDEGADDAPAEERTATSVGGTAKFRFSDGRVTLVFATPADGFAVDVEDSGDEVRVTFTSGNHESRIDADHEDGEPRIRVREDAED